jgi:outer membrane protein assembly factor BamD
MLLGPGCAYVRDSKPPETPEDEFAEAKKEYEEGHYYDAVQMLTAFIDKHPGSVLVDQAIFFLGQSYVGQKDWILASTEFERLVRDFPDSRHACDAEFALGSCYWRESKKPSYDQEQTNQAVEQLHRYRGRCPDHPRAATADSILALARDRLAEKRYRTAELYKRLGQSESAIIYCNLVVEEYGDSRWVCPARRLKVELLARVLRRDEARSELRWLKENCPDEPGLGELERQLGGDGS